MNWEMAIAWPVIAAMHAMLTIEPFNWRLKARWPMKPDSGLIN